LGGHGERNAPPTALRLGNPLVFHKPLYLATQGRFGFRLEPRPFNLLGLLRIPVHRAEFLDDRGRWTRSVRILHLLGPMIHAHATLERLGWAQVTTDC